MNFNQRKPSSRTAEETMAGPYCVGFRQTDAGQAMTRHLIAQGKKRIVFAAAQLDPRVMQRLKGWRIALKDSLLYDPTLEWLNPAASSLALGGLMFEQIIKQSPAVDAIFFCNDDLAQGALLAAMRLGISGASTSGHCRLQRLNRQRSNVATLDHGQNAAGSGRGGRCAHVVATDSG